MSKIIINGKEYNSSSGIIDTEFTSNDVEDNNATSWTSIDKLESKESIKSILNKISTMFKNIRYLYKSINELNTDLSGGLSVRYDEATDYVQIKSNGVWINWRKGNVNKYYLIADGVAQVSFEGHFTQTSSTFTIYRNSVDDYVGASTIDIINSTGYSRLKAEIRNKQISDPYLRITMGAIYKDGNGNTTSIQSIELTNISSAKVKLTSYGNVGSYDIINLWLE